jgi:ubiquinone/menaquinone biosynthesis C-methylase UbiE
MWYDTATMSTESLLALVKPQTTIDRDSILVTKEIAEKTVWDKLAIENPTNAVISAKDETEAAKKSLTQIADIKQHVTGKTVVLDLGTGYGRVAQYLLPDMVISGYIGLDSSFEMLTLFKRRYKERESEQRTPLLLLNADIHTLPLTDASVDVVIVSAVFLHNHKSVVEQALTELKRVMKLGATILVYSSFPRAATLMGMQGLAYQAVLNLTGRAFKNGPVRYYWRSEIMHLFDGFSSVELKPVGFAFLPKTLIFLPQPLERLWRLGVANPVNQFLERFSPRIVKYYCAVHFDVVAKK